MIDSLILMAAAPPAGQGQGSPLGTFLPLIIIFAIFYLLLIRPQQKKAKEHQNFLEKLEKGAEVITSGGMIGRVTGIANNIITLEIAPKIKVKVTKSSIAGLAPKGATEEDKA